MSTDALQFFHDSSLFRRGGKSAGSRLTSRAADLLATFDWIDPNESFGASQRETPVQWRLVVGPHNKIRKKMIPGRTEAGETFYRLVHEVVANELRQAIDEGFLAPSLSQTRRAADHFLRQVSSDAEVKGVAFIDEGPSRATIYTCIEAPIEETELRVFNCEKETLEAFPELDLDFALLYLCGEQPEDRLPPTALRLK